VRIEVARRNSVVETVTHTVHPCDRENKRALLAHLIKDGNWHQVLVFVGTKHGTSRLARQLVKDGIEATDIHGDKSQPQRTQALEDFKAGKVAVLVATDVAARGLDIEELPHVVNFDLPYTPEDYVHRVGRTGRAGMKGDAVSLVCEEEEKNLAEIEKLLKAKLVQVPVPGFERGARVAAPSHGSETRERPPGRSSRHQPGPARAPGGSSAPRRERGAESPSAAPAERPRRGRDPEAERRKVIDKLGFDPYQPYESTSAPAPAPADSAAREPRGPRRPVAALLGGLAKKT
jgi:ATP-dependent RNA helicase RhlE